MAALPAPRDLIDGSFRTPSRTLPGTLDDPNTGATIEQQVATSAEDVDAALAAASRVHLSREWLELGVEGRAHHLLALADELEARADAIAAADALNPGIVISLASPMAGGCAEQVRGAAAQLLNDGDGHDLPGKGRGGPVRLRRDPWGPAVVLAPWNAPSPTAVGKTAAALAAGCPVILKPSEWAPGSSRVLAEAAYAAGLPAGVFQLVHGGAEVAQQLVRDPRIRAVSLTGGQAAGRAVAVAAAPNFTRLQLELGGNNPALVLEDADIPFTARAIVAGMTKLNGQWCESPGRVFVDAAHHDALVEALLDELQALVVGPSTHPGTDVGPLAFRRHRSDVASQVERLQARGGTVRWSHPDVPHDGWFLSPAVVVDVDPADAHDEVFGPVVTVHRMRDADEGVELANASPDGLAGYVFGGDVERALSVGARLRGGEVKVNGTSLFDLTPESHQSFWGASGLGGHGAGESLEFFRGNRIVGVDDPDAGL